MINIEVNGFVVAVKSGSTVRQAADVLGIEIPRFCFHERLRVAGNCRICLVEVLGSPKPVASCAIPASNGMKVFTDSPLVKKARESVIELLRANHPLDCPICDQGGECDLQDQSIRYGSDRTRMYLNKRGVEDKELGPLVKMVITRCIHCTRCIRFASEVAGVGLLGTSGRGSDTEVGTYVERIIDSERSGNRVDRCPVGALTSKPLAFTARPWELDSVDTYDDSDGIIASIRIQVLGNTLHRVMPRNNDDVNAEWLGDKGRYIVDGFKHIRRDNVKSNVTNIDNIIQGVQYVCIVLDNMTKVSMLVGTSNDIESMLVIKNVIDKAPLSIVNSVTLGYSDVFMRNGFKSDFTFSSGFASVASIDIVVNVHTDVRKEAPVRNVLLRDAYIHGAVMLNVGNQLRSTYPNENVGELDLLNILGGDNMRSITMININKLMFMFGSSIYNRDDGFVRMLMVVDSINNIKISVDDIMIYNNSIHKSSNVIGAISLGLSGFNSLSNVSSGSSLVNVGVSFNDIVEHGLMFATNTYNDYSYLNTIMHNYVYTVMFTPWVDSIDYDLYVPIVSNHEQESILVSSDGRYNHMKKVITGVMSTDEGSVNADMMSTVLSDGKTDQLIVGDWYAKRMFNMHMLYEGIDNSCNVKLIPAVHNYYTEGHTAAANSQQMLECSVYSNQYTFSDQ